MSWLPALLPFVVGILLVFVPGLLVTCAARLRGFDALAIAPAISTALMAVSAIAAPMVGVRWALWVPFALALIVAALGFAVVYGLQKASLLDAPAGRRLSSSIALTPMTWSVRVQAWHYVAVALSFIFLLRNMTNALGQPDWISQTWDNIFHLNAVRYIADEGNGSALFVGTMTARGGEAGFYPTAWHDFVSLIFMNTGSTIPVATNAFVLVVSTVVWPIALIYMVRSIFPAGRFALVVTGIAASAMPAFPFLLTYHGVLYPNLLGYALVPVGIGMMAQLFRVGLVRYLATAQSVFLGIFVALGVSLAHPNAIMSMLALVVPIFAARLVLQIVAAVRRETPAWAAVLQSIALVGLYFFVNYLWGVIRPPEEAGAMWNPEKTQAQALGEMFFNQSLATSKPLWAVTALFVVGAFFLVLAKNRLYWIFGTWAVLAYFYAAVNSLDWADGRYDVVGVWYNDAFRVAALIPTVTLIFVAYGCHKLAEKTSALEPARLFRGKLEPAKAALVSGTVAAVVLAYLLQTAAPLQNYIAQSFWKYAPNSESELLSPDEENILQHLDDFVPEDETIVVQAFNGGSLAYAYANREVTSYHVMGADDPTADESYIYQHLNQANVDPKVCQIVNDENLGYYLEFGHVEVNDADHRTWYPGFEELVENGVVQEVYRAGGAKLYEITACE